MEAKVFTNKICYKILLQGVKEALECEELKQFLHTPDGKAYSGGQFNIFGGNNDLIVNSKIKEFMNFAFFRFMDRQQKLIESIYFINESEFYSKCIQALNIELTKRASKEPTTIQEMKKIRLTPFFELDDFDPLQYLSTTKWDLEQRAFVKPLQQPKPEAPQQNKEIENYLKSYKHHLFSSVIDKRNKENKENVLFYGKDIAGILEQRNSELLTNEILKEKYNLLSTYNKYLFFLTGHTMQLFKAVNDYSNTANSGYFTKIKIKEDEVFDSLNELKKLTKSIKHNLLNEEIKIASKIRYYCILMFDDCIDLLKDQFGIDIYASPLKVHFESVNKAFESSINFEELKLIKDFETNPIKVAKQVNTKSKELYTPKPCFKPESIESITNVLNTFFNPLQHDELKRIIETGGNAKEKLLFRDNGNKLTDCFRQLYENNTIVSCTKTVLINWIVDNFEYTNGRIQKNYDFKSVEKIISSKDRLCKNPII